MRRLRLRAMCIILRLRIMCIILRLRIMCTILRPRHRRIARPLLRQAKPRRSVPLLLSRAASSHAQVHVGRT